MGIMNGDAVVGTAGVHDEPRNPAPQFVENLGEGVGGRGEVVVCIDEPMACLQVIPNNCSFVSMKELPPDFAHLPLLLDAVQVRERLARCVGECMRA